MRITATFAFLALGLHALLPQPASAFCGFYVAGAEGGLTNKATQVVLLRDGTRTVLSMQNDYEGPVEDFAMVVPVPEVLREESVKVLRPEVFDRINTLAAPRLVEYWEQDPCSRNEGTIALGNLGTIGRGGGGSGNGYGRGVGSVRVEAEFAVGEYEIQILSADDSSGLEVWLTTHGYRVPAGASEALRPYVERDMKFFVAKVDASKARFENGRAVLSPLRVEFESETFSLPVRLGMLNSAGTQDLVVHILADGQRYEVANYPNVLIPTNIDVVDGVRDRYNEFYAALFDDTLAQNPGAVVTEYAWGATSCDPCPGPTLNGSDLVTLGEKTVPPAELFTSDIRSFGFTGPHREITRRIFRRHSNELRFCHERELHTTPGLSGSVTVSLSIDERGETQNVVANGPDRLASVASCVQAAVRRWTFDNEHPREVRATLQFRLRPMPTGPRSVGAPSRYVLTRLHYRYAEGGLGEDLVFRAAPPISGGREGVVGGSLAPSNTFQGRYIIRHEWDGPMECESPVRGVWGPPPEGTAQTTSATDSAIAPRGALTLSQWVRGTGTGSSADAPAMNKSAPVPPSPAQTAPAQAAPVQPSPATGSSGMFGCGVDTASSMSGALMFAFAVVVVVRRRR